MFKDSITPHRLTTESFKHGLGYCELYCSTGRGLRKSESTREELFLRVSRMQLSAHLSEHNRWFPDKVLFKVSMISLIKVTFPYPCYDTCLFSNAVFLRENNINHSRSQW